METILAALLLIFLPVLSVLPEAQPQSPRASVEGVVVRIGTGEPIDGAEVKMTQIGALPDTPHATRIDSADEPIDRVLSTISDRNGKFVLKNLDSGSYRITAARNGYAKQEYGRLTIGGQGTIVSLASGQTMTDVVLHLTPAGNVGGHVRDFTGQPLTGFQVLLLKFAYNSTGRRAFETAGAARTDDRGEYRFYWVTPGRYYLSAGLGNGPNENSSFRNPNEVQARPYPTTYYPSTRDPSEASAVDIQPAAELSAIDFVLPQLQLYRIRGKVIDAATGRPPLNVEVTIVPRQPFGPFNTSNANDNYNPDAGTIELRDVAPGSYWISAATSPDFNAPIGPGTVPRTATDFFLTLISSTRKAREAVDISASDLENLALTLTPGISLHGRLSVEGQELSAINGFERIQVRLSATSNMTIDEQFPRPMTPDGMFSLDNMLPGQYRLTVTFPQQDFYVKEARLGSVDLLNAPLLISGPISDTLDIVLGSGAGQIDGTIVNEQLQPMGGVQAVLIPDRFRDRTELYKTAVTDQSGRFTIRGITPGEYKIFAWEAMEQFAYFDSDLLRVYEQKGEAINVLESSKNNIEVKVIP
jgi:hypothetical protein